jgi:hypothetical protein
LGQLQYKTTGGVIIDIMDVGKTVGNEASTVMVVHHANGRLGIQLLRVVGC